MTRLVPRLGAYFLAYLANLVSGDPRPCIVVVAVEVEVIDVCWFRNSRPLYPEASKRTSGVPR